jgi:hypothetical protein
LSNKLAFVKFSCCGGALYSSSVYDELARGEAVLLDKAEEARGAVFTLAIQYIILKVAFSFLVFCNCPG